MKPENTEGGGRCTAAECAAADCMAVDRTAADHRAADRTAADRTAADCTAADRTGTESPAADSRKARRRSAIQSAVLFTVMHLVAAGILLWVRAGQDPASFLAKCTLVLTGFELVSVVPLWFSLKARLKEIEGGEEDAAAQY